MRMWLVPPEVMCRKHLLGEHVEMHMFVGTINKGTSIQGYISDGLVEVHRIKARHDALAEEMTHRGYNHASPLPEFEAWQEGSVDPSKSQRELIRRCKECYQKERPNG